MSANGVGVTREVVRESRTAPDTHQVGLQGGPRGGAGCAAGAGCASGRLLP